MLFIRVFYIDNLIKLIFLTFYFFYLIEIKVDIMEKHMCEYTQLSKYKQ